MATDYDAQITRLYDTVFGRAPDATGLEFWVSHLRSGTHLGAVAEGFMHVPEWRDAYGDPGDAEFVGLLYRNILDREGEPHGKAFWEQHLASGTERKWLVVGFSESDEHKAQMAAPQPEPITNQTLNGTDGDDSLQGGAGNDTLTGFLGTDTLSGGPGNDTLLGGVEPGRGSYVVNLQGDGGDLLDGGGGADSAFGDQGDDVISGGPGDDTLSGWIGNDRIDGGAGNDRIDGGADGVRLLNYGEDADTLDGGDGDDTINGFSGNDVISGGSGNDVISGWVGADTLSGNAGADRFVFGFTYNGADIYEAGGTGPDTVTDFTQGEDVLDLSRLNHGPGDVAFTWIGTAEFTGAGEPQARYTATAEGAALQLDVSQYTDGANRADGTTDLEILLPGVRTLSAADFAL